MIKKERGFLMAVCGLLFGIMGFYELPNYIYNDFPIGLYIFGTALLGIHHFMELFRR